MEAELRTGRRGEPRSGAARSATPEPSRRAIEQRAIHLHFHGVSAEDIAAILDRRDPTL